MVERGARKQLRDEDSRDDREQRGEAEICEGPDEHLGRRPPGLVRVPVHHGPDERADHEHGPRDSRKERTSEDQQLQEHKDETDHEEHDDLVAGEPRDVVAREEKREADQRHRPGNSKAGRLELDVRTDDTAEEEQGREGREPEGNALEACGVDPADLAGELGVREHRIQGGRDGRGEHGLALEHTDCLLRAEREQTVRADR